MILGTQYVKADELALALYEINLLSPDGWHRKRYEIIKVVRDGKEAEYRRDLGMAKDYTAEPFRIPSYLEHTVGELRDIANRLRETIGFDRAELLSAGKTIIT